MIFLDLPAYACVWGIARRCLRHCGGRHAEAGVRERVTWNFVRYVVGYRRAMRPRVIALIAEHALRAHHVTVTSRREADRILPRPPSAGPRIGGPTGR